MPYCTLATSWVLWAAEGGSPLTSMVWPLVAIFALFYFLLIRPQNKERTKRDQMLGELKKNDRVVTVGGIYGVVTNVHREEDKVTLKVDEATNAKLNVTLGSIARIAGGDASDDSSRK